MALLIVSHILRAVTGLANKPWLGYVRSNHDKLWYHGPALGKTELIYVQAKVRG